jgi:glycosyltransferase involved in cell wall biosynthesis
VPSVAIVTPFKATYFKPLFEAFAQAQPAGWKTVMVWPDSHTSEHPQELLTPVAPNIEIVSVASSLRARAGGSRTFTPSWEMFRTLTKIRPEIVLIQEYSLYALAGLFYARWQGIPVVSLTEVGQRNQHFFTRKTRLWHGWWSRWIQGIAAACPAAHTSLSGRKLPSTSVYHAVDSRLYLPHKPSGESPDVTFVYVGQLIHRKGLDLWLQAAKRLKEQSQQHFKLRIIGRGEEAWVQQLIAQYDLHDQIDWRGFLSGGDLREAMASADVFVLPTRQDTYAAVVHEAACVGLPLLVSKHAGAAEALVREGVNGHVFDPEDIQQLCQQMEHLLQSDVRQRMSSEARATGELMSAHVRGGALWHFMAKHSCLLQTPGNVSS